MSQKSGFFGIGCFNMKTAMNYGTLFRSAHILGADFIFLIGGRFKAQASDTTKASRHLPLYQYPTFEDFQKNLPHGAELVGIELDANSVPLQTFDHPRRAIYLLGAEDNGLPRKVLDCCQHIVQLPGIQSLNVATAGSIALYDRILKGGVK